MFYSEFIYRCAVVLNELRCPISGKELIYKAPFVRSDHGYCFNKLKSLESLPFVKTGFNGNGNKKYQWHDDFRIVSLKYGAGPNHGGDSHDWFCYTKAGKYYVSVPQNIYPLAGDTCVIRITDTYRREAELVQVLRRTDSLVECVVEEQNNEFYGRPVKSTVYANSVKFRPDSGVNRGERVLLLPDAWMTNGRPVGTVKRVLNSGTEFTEDFRAVILDKYGIGHAGVVTEDIPPNEPNGLSKSVIDNYADMSRFPWIAVGRKDAAFSVRRFGDYYKAAVCITHLPKYIPLGGPIDTEFRKYGETCRLRDRVMPIIGLHDAPMLDLTVSGWHVGVYFEFKIGADGKILSWDAIECFMPAADYVTVGDLDSYLSRREWGFESQHPNTLQCIMEFAELTFVLSGHRDEYSAFSCSYLDKYTDLLWVVDACVTASLKTVDFPFIGSKCIIPDDFDLFRKDRLKTSVLNTIRYETITRYAASRPVEKKSGFVIRVADAANRYADFINLGLYISHLRHTLANDEREAAWIPVAGKIADEMNHVDRRVRSAEREYALRFDNAVKELSAGRSMAATTH